MKFNIINIINLINIYKIYKKIYLISLKYNKFGFANNFKLFLYK